MSSPFVDLTATVAAERYALVRTARRQRARCAASCVTLVASAEDAQAARDEARGVRPAIVYGPSVSSEGQRIYYLVRWL